NAAPRPGPASGDRGTLRRPGRRADQRAAAEHPPPSERGRERGPPARRPQPGPRRRRGRGTRGRPRARTARPGLVTPPARASRIIPHIRRNESTHPARSHAMAGHSKWANIKHRKAAQDKKRGKIWSKCSKAIMAAARSGGPALDTNLALRYAVDEAKYANMPKDTIQRAIDKGAGNSGGEDFRPVVFEGYGPGSTAMIIEGLTDNNTRTVNEIRSIFNKLGGNLGTTGSVAFMFQTKGRIILDASKYAEDRVMEAALEAGADDVQPPENPGADEPGVWTVLTE